MDDGFIAGIYKSVILYNANLNPNLELLWGDVS